MSTRQNASRELSAAGSTVLERLEPLLSGLLIAIVVMLTLGVAVTMGASEQVLVARVEPTPLPTITALPAAPTLPPAPTALPTAWPSPSQMPPSATTAPTQKPTPRPAAKATSCPIPPTWQPYTVRSGDSLQTLAWRYGTSDYRLLQTNCLTSWILRAGQRIYVPSVALRPACGPPRGWVTYTIRLGDTLSSISRRLGVSISALMNANCLMSDEIYTGAPLWVPRPLAAPTLTPTRRAVFPNATRVPTSTATSPATGTAESTVPAGSPTAEATGVTPPPETSPTDAATATSVPGNTPPTSTPVPVPPTSTPRPPDTPVPPPDTPVPPPDTPVPPPDTPVPPPDTPVPPPDTPVPTTESR